MLTRTPRPIRTATALAVLALLVASCAASDDADAPTPSAEQLAVAPANFDLAVGPPARFLVGLFTGDKANIGYGTVQLRFTWLGDGTQREPGPEAEASFLQLPNSATVPPPPVPAVLDYQQGRGVYTASVAFDRPGFWEVEVDAHIEPLGARQATGTFEVEEHHQLPAPGDPAIASDNPTIDHPQSTPPAGIDSRAGDSSSFADIPDPDLHQTSIAEAIADHRPAVIAFTTPVYCVSQFCGPITDMLSQLEDDNRDRAAFVHIEIWENFEQRKVNPTAEQWINRDGEGREPWVYIIDANGIITHRFDNVATAAEIQAALDEVAPPSR